ncbi:MAG: ABC transporter permease [Cyclobacteriaceae bacterium]
MNKVKPPKSAIRFFKWYCRNELRESILGDLEERFNDECEEVGNLRAKFKYWINVFKFINRHTLKSETQSKYQSSHSAMIKSNLLTSIRYLLKHKGYTSINILGLSLGLGSCLLIFYFINHEVGFDKFHDNHENIYRIISDNPDNTGAYVTFLNSPPALAPGIRDLIPEVNKATQLRYALRSLFRNGDRSFYEDFGFYADSVFLEIFSFKLKNGNINTALDEPNTIVMTEAMAARYFDDENPVGQLITMNNDLTLRVAGILAPIPSNSHLRFDYLISFSTYQIPDGYFSDLSSWRWLGFLTYVELQNGSNPADFKAKLDEVYTSKTQEGRKPLVSQVQSLKDIYLGSNGMIDDLASHMRNGNNFSIYALGSIALLILLIAGFNFMNLTVAFSMNRGKEIGLRKVLGANRTKLIFQLLTESIVVSVISLALAYSFAILSFPYVKSLLEWDLALDWSLIFNTFPIVIGFSIVLGILGGIYPSFLLARFQTIAALKGQLKVGGGMSGKLKNVLVVIQFCISIGLIASTIVVTKQINFLRDQSLGFDKENVMVIKLLPTDMSRYYEVFKQNILQSSEILSVSRGERKMGDPWPVNPILVDGKDRSEARQVVGNLVDYDFLKTMGINLISGRSFSKEFANDSTQSIIISESTVRQLGLEDPIGKKLRFFTIDGPRTVIGVTEDFNFSSLHNATSPTVLIMPFIGMEHLFIRTNAGNLSEKVALVEEEWNEVAPGIPLDIQFMDDDLNNLYNKEEKLGLLITGFSGLAVILACLGLYGLVAFMVNNRMKEIGVRKVLGASLPSLMVLLSRNYLILIGIASAIVIPGLHYILNLWLDNFAYRINVEWWIYGLAGFTLLLIALLTISNQTIRAALMNPVKVLRDE